MHVGILRPLIDQKIFFRYEAKKMLEIHQNSSSRIFTSLTQNQISGF